MKKILCITTVVCFFSMFSFAACVAEPGMSEGSLRYFTLEFSMDKASEDIAKNMEFWVGIHRKVDAGTGESWKTILGEKLPSQPVAVIQVLARTNATLHMTCPKFFHEDTRDWEMDAWYKLAIPALESFTLNDPKAEAVRQQCLKDIMATPKAGKVMQQKSK